MAVAAQITITVAEHDGVPGLLASLKTSGDYSSDVIDSHFYSFSDVPPDEVSEHQFWGVTLAAIGKFLMNGYR